MTFVSFSQNVNIYCDIVLDVLLSPLRRCWIWPDLFTALHSVGGQTECERLRTVKAEQTKLTQSELGSQIQENNKR